MAGVQVLDHYDELDTVKGIAYRQSGDIVRTPPQDHFVDLDQIPDPDFSLFDIERYLSVKNAYAGGTSGLRSMSVLTSRGLPLFL